MKKRVICTLSVPVFLVSVFVLVFQGFGMPSISPLWHIILRILAGLSAQAFFILVFKHPALRIMPLILTALLGILGGCLFMMNFDWQNAALDGYLADYCTPVMGCLAAVLLLQEENPRRLGK